MAHLLQRLSRRLGAGGERGDVPGWVLVTAMTVALALLIWGVASPALEGVITDYMNRIQFP